MSAPLLKGLLITASVLVAAGLAIYENEEIRRLIEEYRRRVAEAFYSMGDNISPHPSGRSSESPGEMEEMIHRRREEIVMRNRAELVRQARAEGIAVDLDELAALGLLDEKAIEHGAYRPQNFTAPATSHGRDGQPDVTKTSSFQHAPDYSVRHRGNGARGFDAGAAFASPFDDSEVMFDRHLIGPAHDELPSSSSPSLGQNIASLSPRPVSRVLYIPGQKSQLIDDQVVVSEKAQEPQSQSQYKINEELEADIQEAIRLSLADDYAGSTGSDTLENEAVPSISGADSLFDPFSSPDHVLDSINARPQSSHSVSSVQEVLEAVTPTSVLSIWDDGPELLMADRHSETGETNDSFSDIGASTPSSWTDVESDADTELVDGRHPGSIRQPQA